ncbi:uncharacterized protein LOC117226058 isoform X2 [Megalopta genalis]|uniref:uncharacterized protein LOC117226058 isoform X2 n=1 Tax=Megalopta genalis TaxID=115081 RepID=UPI00144368F0|nr:uncharacterized protein LOC117226058 isoform X2 [Megalopta genalis]
MPSTKDPFGEDVSLLYDARYQGIPEDVGTPIIKGVVNQLRKWPADLFRAFLAVCLIIASMVLLTFVMVAVSLPSVVGNRIETSRILDVKESSNVYFLKLGHRNWSTREFCYVETAARKHPDLSLHLINLLREEPLGNQPDDPIETRASTNANESLATDSRPAERSSPTPEDRIKERLRIANPNIKTVDLSVGRFFKGSKLSRVAKSLDDDVLELAAKAQLLWSVPGIAVKPSMFCALDTVKRFLCNGEKDRCVPDQLATIEPDNDIQATAVPCQAFMGFLVQEISKTKFDGKFTINEALRKYCPRLYYCPEVRNFDTGAKCSTDSLDCPTVYSSVLTKDDPDSHSLIT